MAIGHPFGLAPLWEGEISVPSPATSNSAQQGSVWNGDPKGQPVLLFSCGSGWGPCPVVTAKVLVPGEAALLTEWAWVTLVPV